MLDQFVADRVIEMRLAGRLVEQPEQRQALFIVDRRDHVGVADVVNPRHVLVADAFDAMAAEAELVERRALQRLGGDDAKLRMHRPQEIAGGDRAGAARGGNVAGQVAGPPPSRLKDLSIVLPVTW